MPQHTIVVNQGDLKTNVPLGKTVQEILPTTSSSFLYGTYHEESVIEQQENSLQQPKCGQSTPPIPQCDNSLSGGQVELVASLTKEEIDSREEEVTPQVTPPHTATQVPVNCPTTRSGGVPPASSSQSNNSSVEEESKMTIPTTSAAAAVAPNASKYEESDLMIKSDVEVDSYVKVASNTGWGIPHGFGLRGGGINSLNNGTSGWGTPPSNVNAANTGWGAPPGGGGGGPSSNSAMAPTPPGGGISVNSGGVLPHTVSSLATCSSSGGPSSSPPNIIGTGGGAPSAGNNNLQSGTNQWASTSPNRNASQNSNNGQPIISGSQMNNNPSGNASGQGATSGGANPMQLSNQNMVNNGMNTGGNTGVGNPNAQQQQPGGQGQQGVGGVAPNQNVPGGGNPANSGGIIPNAGGSSWAQAAGKSLQTVGGVSGGGVGGAGVNPGNNSNMNSNNNQQPSVGGGMVHAGGAIGGGGPGPGPSSGTSASTVSTKQIELLASMKEALFSPDGWGGQHVNQESHWDIPGSPEPTHKDLGGGQMSAPAGAAVWKPNVNNGTELWETNLRNGGAPPPAPPAQKPWGHTPSTNIGGTWGEEDDGGDQANVWNPQASNNAPGPNQPQVNANSGGGSTGWGINSGPQQPPQREPSNGMWNSAPMKKETNEWGGSGGGGGRGGPEGGRGHGPHGGGGGPDSRGGVGMVGHENNQSGRGGWDDGRNIGRINNGSNVDQNPGMWNKPQPPVQQPPVQQSGWGGPPGGVIQGHGGMGMPGAGGMGGMKENLGQGVGGGNKGQGGSGWDDVSPPTQRRPVPNIPNYDDGTALWGNPIPGQQPQQQQQHPQQRGMPPNRGMQNKMDDGNQGWGQTNRNGGWNGPDGPQDTGFNTGGRGGGGGGGGGGWDDKPSIGSWNDPQMQQQQQQGNSWGKPKTPTQPSGWGDDGIVDTSNWGAPPKNTGSRYHSGSPNANSNTTKDPYWSNSNNRPNYRLLADLGYKKDEIELALRASNMNISDAIDSLDAGSGRGPPMDQSLWGGGGPMPQQRRGPPPPVDDHFDLGLGVGPGGPMGMGPPHQQRYGVPNPKGFSGGNSLMNNVSNPSHGGSINPTLLQRILTQQQPNNPPQPGRVQQNNAGGGSQGQFPFNKSVTVLVNQIQCAVQAGYLSNQILQHPLPPQSLVLLNSLLQQIKNFQMLTQAQQQMGNNNSPAYLQLNVQVTKTKQHIQNLHNQIAAQQAQHAKQQQQQQHPGHHHHLGVGGNQPNNDLFRAPPIIGDGRGGGGGGGGGGPSGSNLMSDPMSALQTNFGSDFMLNNKESGGQQSRLHQWTKLPSMDKDDGAPGGDFSRAPGPSNNNGAGLLKNNAGMMLGQSDNTWSTSVSSRTGSDGWPTDHSNVAVGGKNSQVGMGDDGKSMSNDGWQTDLVPEFEPGKPWKGTQIMKSVDEDPTLTPGSVVRSPLSLNVIKDATEIFKNASSSTGSSIVSDTLPMSLSTSNTWSYTPAASQSSVANSLAKLNSTRDLWDYGSGGNGGGGGQGSRPPPGLPKKGAGPSTPVPNPGSGGSGSNSFRNNSWGNPQGGGGPQGNLYLWLLLRNLTPQIDGSTLKTLCIQHGPLIKFHLYLNQGVALVRYSTCQEAAKAQNALNNCVLGNTTILAESTSENDVHDLLQRLSAANVNNARQQQEHQQQQQNNPGFAGVGGNSSNSRDDPNPWGVLRDTSPLWSSNPWGSGLDAPDRATPSSLNALLPDGLLGSEST